MHRGLTDEHVDECDVHCEPDIRLPCLPRSKRHERSITQTTPALSSPWGYTVVGDAQQTRNNATSSRVRNIAPRGPACPPATLAASPALAGLIRRKLRAENRNHHGGREPSIRMPAPVPPRRFTTDLADILPTGSGALGERTMVVRWPGLARPRMPQVSRLFRGSCRRALV
jgi:hypothetical protein